MRPELRRWWPVVVPVVWAAAILGVMRPDAIKARDEIPDGPKWAIYDESDLTAFALRAANAQTDRLPGRPDDPGWPYEGVPAEADLMAKKLDAPPPPLTDRYYLEYPPAALLLFRLGYLIQPGRFELPAAVADCHQYPIGVHVPRNDTERALWTRFHVAVQFYVVVMAGALVGLMVVLGRGYRPGVPTGPLWLTALPAAVYFSLNRYDILPALATALSFAALGRGRRGWAGALLAVGALLKVYPVVFVPVVLRYLGPRASVRWLAGFGGVIAVGAGLSMLALGWEGAVAPIRLQLARTYEPGNWSLYGYVLPEALAGSSAGRLALLGLAVLGAVITRPTSLEAVLRRSALVLIVFVNLSVFWSPQWVVWFLPLLVPLAERRSVAVAAATLDITTYFSFPILFWNVMAWDAVPPDVKAITGVGIVYVRAAVWARLAVMLVWESRLVAGSAESPDFARSSR